MRMILISIAAVVCGAAVGGAIADAPGQTTAYPGQMTQAHVWIQNRGRDQAVPVDVRDVHLDAPLRVQVINGEASAGVLPVRLARQAWEYQTLTVSATAAPAALGQRGADGWEATGVAWTTSDGTTLLLKRPR
jgi:hypothetical protein